jgi:predicted SPOUT superfamily RNA methylase MTH1
MYLLKKGSFSFAKINENGYEIDEQPNLIAKVQFVNGNRKKIVTSYEDVVITIKLKGLNGSDVDTYLDNLTDGVFEYYSVKDKSYKYANFVVTIPPIALNKAFSTTELYVDELEVILEKSSDYGASI